MDQTVIGQVLYGDEVLAPLETNSNLTLFTAGTRLEENIGIDIGSVIDPNNIPSTNVFHKTEDVRLFDLIESYILDIDYDKILAFDVNELVIGLNGASSPILGVGRLGYMILA